MKKRPVPARSSSQSAARSVASPSNHRLCSRGFTASRSKAAAITKAVRRSHHGPAQYFHYTSIDGLRGILQSGIIRPTVWSASEYAPALSMVWCSSARTWEPSSSAAGVLEAAGIEDIRDGAYLAVARIRVQPQGLCAWQERLADHPKMIVSLGLYGMDCGSRPDNWFVASQPIAAADWMAVELWDGSRWQPLEAVADPSVADLRALRA